MGCSKSKPVVVAPGDAPADTNAAPVKQTAALAPAAEAEMKASKKLAELEEYDELLVLDVDSKRRSTNHESTPAAVAKTGSKKGGFGFGKSKDKEVDNSGKNGVRVARVIFQSFP